MVDVVYVLGNGSAWDNNELRYSLRSVERHLKNYRDVYIIGECPEWLQNIIHIPAQDLWHGSRNIMEKVLKACRITEVSDDFLFMNDDFFFLKNVDAPTYPTYHRGALEKAIPKNAGNWYQEYVIETIGALTKSRLSTLNFDIHEPIIYNKKHFLFVMDLFDWNRKLTVKSIYANALSIQGVQMEDCKISGRMARWYLDKKIKDRHIFSIADKCLTPYPGESESSVKVLLNELFPNKSKYEL